ncbi:MAG TPA: FAD:protein FMN transferase, partial [Actinomycetota bacterium]|nr:FAD:protein FMN transferase [Actinomycetota bacterium]
MSPATVTTSGHRFHSMGCEVVVGGGSPPDHAAIERLFAERDWIFSRFVPDSELNRVNDAAGRFVPVSDLFADTLRTALRVAEETDGVVDPTLGAAIESAGYTRDFAMLEPDDRPPGAPVPGAWRRVLVFGRQVGNPVGVRLDLNGVVKAMAVDDALALLRGEGFVSAGGDVAARGELTVALPDGEPVTLRQGALATSGDTGRRWLRGGVVQHHLIDARTGAPARSPWSEVTACGATCLAADVAAKAGYLLGEEGPEWLDRRGIPARFRTKDGDAVPNETWRQQLR